jgi:hypothetical protein
MFLQESDISSGKSMFVNEWGFYFCHVASQSVSESRLQVDANIMGDSMLDWHDCHNYFSFAFLWCPVENLTSTNSRSQSHFSPKRSKGFECLSLDCLSVGPFVSILLRISSKMPAVIRNDTTNGRPRNRICVLWHSCLSCWKIEHQLITNIHVYSLWCLGYLRTYCGETFVEVHFFKCSETRTFLYHFKFLKNYSELHSWDHFHKAASLFDKWILQE